jgi:hypothetical protein
VTRWYTARYGQRQLRECDGCGRAEVVLPVQRPRAHFPAHTIRTAAAVQHRPENLRIKLAI